MTLLYKRKKLLYFAANLKDLPKIADFKVEVDKFLSNFYNFFMNQHIVHALHTYILVVSVANPVPHLFHIIMGIIRCRIQIPTKDSCLRIRILWIQKWIRMFVVFNIYFSIVKSCIIFWLLEYICILHFAEGYLKLSAQVQILIWIPTKIERIRNPAFVSRKQQHKNGKFGNERKL